MTTRHPRIPALLGAGAIALTGFIIAPTAQAAKTADGLMDIVITQTGAHEDHLYSVGDTLSFNIDVTNLATEARSFTVDETDLGGDVKKCRWSRIEANAKKTDCVGYATHTVTEEDLTGGSFTPEISYKTQQPSYQGEALNTPETIRGDAVPLKASQITVESMTVSDPKDAYKEGDTVEVVVRVRSHSKDTIDVATTSSSFDDLTTQCNWGSLAPGAGAVYNCKPLHHTITAEDVKTGSYTPSITLTASKGGEVLQTLTPTGEALAVQGVYPEATPAPLPDASVSLPASMSEGASVATGTAADNVRIPAITTAPNGDLLVSYDQRPLTGWDASGNDSPNPNSIVQRRSTDGGATWGAPTYIHKGVETGAKEGYSDPSYVIDAETGAIFNFHVKSFDAGWRESRAGADPADRGVIQAEVSTSIDNGHTWTHKVITPDITSDASWISRFAASGQGIQIQHGDHKGRLVQQFTIKLSNGTVQAVSVYSDDHGATWKAGTPAGTGMDENKVVELSDGRLMMNSRVSDSSGYRKTAISTDGGQTWSEPVSDKNLPDSVDNAQIIRAFPNAAPGTDRAKVLLLSHSPNPAPWSRDRGTISLSCDDGATWTGKVFRAERVGYTTLAVKSDGSLGLLSEDVDNRTIAYRSFSLAWLGSDCPALKDIPSPNPKPEPPAPAPKAGWEKDGNDWRYRNADGSLATGWIWDGAWYFLKADGLMATGWEKDGSTWYYLKPNGAMHVGWHWDGAWYYLTSNGAMATGWEKDRGTWYHFADNGKMETGWVWLAGAWYHLSRSGAMTTGWLQDGGSWYYLKADGAMATGWITVGPSRYYMDPTTGAWRG